MHNRMGLNVYGCFGDAPELHCGYLASRGRGVGGCWKERPAEQAGIAVTPSWAELDCRPTDLALASCLFTCILTLKWGSQGHTFWFRK